MSKLLDLHASPLAASDGAYAILKRYLAIDDDDREAEVIETLEEAAGELANLTNRDFVGEVEDAAGEALFDRLLKEIVAHRFRFKGDEAADLPASVQRVVQRLTRFQM